MSQIIQPVTYTVTEANELVNATLNDQVGQILVEGEVSGVRISRNTWLSFTLKDQHSAVECFTHVRKMSTQLEDGMRVKILATPRLYVPYGKFSLSVIAIEPLGEGALRRTYELLVAKLEREGLFDAARKRPLPRFPTTIAVVTSPDGAALHDIRRVVAQRWGDVTIQLVPVLVQGTQAVGEILAALEYLNTQPVDLMILTRGGGSLEDLAAFNDERVARAVVSSRIPTIVGIGHEQDISIAELVADQRAATPSHAAQLAVPDRETIALELSALDDRLSLSIEQRLLGYRQSLTHATHLLETLQQRVNAAVERRFMRLQAWSATTARQLTTYFEQLSEHEHQLDRLLKQLLRQAHQSLAQTQTLVLQLGPQQILERGYSFTVMVDSGKIVRSRQQVAPGTVIQTRVAQGSFRSEVINDQR